MAREPPLPCCASTHTLPWQSLLAHSSDARRCSGHWKLRDARESGPKHGTARTSCRRGPGRGLGRWRLTAETVCGQRSTRGRQLGGRGVHLLHPGRPPQGPCRLCLPGLSWASVCGAHALGSKSLRVLVVSERALQGLGVRDGFSR